MTSQKPSSPEGQGAKLFYGKSIYDLLGGSNKSTLNKTVLDSRKVNIASLCSGTVVQNIEPPMVHSVTCSHSGSKIKHLVNPQGSQSSTMEYGKIFEDTACHPWEQSVMCGQCLAHHPLHTQGAMHHFIRNRGSGACGWPQIPYGRPP